MEEPTSSPESTTPPDDLGLLPETNPAADSARILFDPCQAPRVSIIVTAWRAAPLLTTCLRSVAAVTAEIPAEVVVALNEPTSQLVSDLDRFLEGGRVLTFPVNLGFAGACNRAAAVARGDFVVLVNDDTEVQPGWLAELVKTADSDLSAGAVGSAMLEPDGSLQEAGAILWQDGRTTAVSQAVVDRLKGRIDLSGVRKVDYCSASSLLVRKSTWDAVGGFDEGFFPAYFEDVDLCLKIAAIGQSVLCQPASTVVHRRGGSSTAFYSAFLGARNLVRFVGRWEDELAEHEPHSEDDGDALLRAVERAASRSATSVGSPEIHSATGERPGTSQSRSSAKKRATAASVSRSEEPRFLRMEVETLREYAAELERTRWYLEAEAARLSGELSDVAQRAADLDSMRAAAVSERASLRSDLAVARRQRDTARAQREELAATVESFRRRASVRIADRLAEAIGRSPGGLVVARRLRRMLRRESAD